MLSLCVVLLVYITRRRVSYSVGHRSAALNSCGTGFRLVAPELAGSQFILYRTHHYSCDRQNDPTHYGATYM